MPRLRIPTPSIDATGLAAKNGSPLMANLVLLGFALQSRQVVLRLPSVEEVTGKISPESLSGGKPGSLEARVFFGTCGGSGMTFGLQIFQFLLSGLTTGSTYALIAIGFSLIHNATGIVNFAQGEFVMLGGMFMITFYSFLNLPMVPAFFLTVVSVAAVGFLLERGPIRHARSKEILILVMITVGASISIKGLSMILWGKNPMTLPPFSGETPLVLAGAAIMPQSIWIFGITLIVRGRLALFLPRDPHRQSHAGRGRQPEIGRAHRDPGGPDDPPFLHPQRGAGGGGRDHPDPHHHHFLRRGRDARA